MDRLEFAAGNLAASVMAQAKIIDAMAAIEAGEVEKGNAMMAEARTILEKRKDELEQLLTKTA